VDQQRIRENAARFRALPSAEREQMREAWRRLEKLPPDERARVLERLLEEPPAEP
jgi:hypothetical protein